MWTKEIKDATPTCVQWSPNGLTLLVGTASGRIDLYDQGGNYIVRCSDTSAHTNGSRSSDASSFGARKRMSGWQASTGTMADTATSSRESHAWAIGFENGLIQLMRAIDDDEPILLSVDLQDSRLRWNHDGSVLAVSGLQNSINENNERSEVLVVHFYDPYGTVSPISGRNSITSDVVSQAVACPWQEAEWVGLGRGWCSLGHERRQ